MITSSWFLVSDHLSARVPYLCFCSQPPLALSCCCWNIASPPPLTLCNCGHHLLKATRMNETWTPWIITCMQGFILFKAPCTHSTAGIHLPHAFCAKKKKHKFASRITKKAYPRVTDIIAGFWWSPVQIATAKQTITVMKQPLQICLVDHLLNITGCRHDNLVLQIVVLMT